MRHLAKVQQVLSGVAIVASLPRSLTSGRNLRSFDVCKWFFKSYFQAYFVGGGGGVCRGESMTFGCEFLKSLDFSFVNQE